MKKKKIILLIIIACAMIAIICSCSNKYCPAYSYGPGYGYCPGYKQEREIRPITAYYEKSPGTDTGTFVIF